MALFLILSLIAFFVWSVEQILQARNPNGYINVVDNTFLLSNIIFDL